MTRATGYSTTGRDYAKFDVLAPEHPKLAELPHRTRWTWFEGICYCHRNLTDGFIPVGIVHARGWGKDAARLVEAGLWLIVPRGFQVHDYLDWNDSRAEVAARIANASKAGKVSAAQRKAERPVEPSVEQSVERPVEQTAQPEVNEPLNGGFNPALLFSALPPKTESTTLPSPSANGRGGAGLARKDREPDLLFDAVIQICGWDKSGLTTDARGRANSAVKQLREVGASPGLVLGFEDHYRSHWPDADLTPQAITKHWATYMAGHLSSPARRRP